MTTMTMPATGERPRPRTLPGVSHLMPLLLSIALLAAAAVVSVLISGPMH